MKRVSAIAIACSLMIVCATAYANTKTYRCHESTCTWEHKLKALQTTTHKVVCPDAPGNQIKRLTCDSGNENVTCTTANYETEWAACDCTNWSSTGKHKAQIFVNCKD